MKPAFLLVLVTLGAVANAQVPVPVSEEPRHRVVFENAHVRVIDAQVLPGDATLFHTHLRDNVPVAISGGRLRTEMAGGETRDSEVRTGAAWFVRGGYTHRITNIGTTPARFLDAELLDAPAPAVVPGIPELAAHVLELENASVRIYRVALRPDRPSSAHVHLHPWLGVAIHAPLTPGAGESLRMSRRVSDLTGAEAGTSDGGGARTPLPFTWHDAGRAEPYRTDPDAAREWVEIEWKD